MRRYFILIGLIFMSYYCFSQQNIPSRIIGNIPCNNSRQAYQIQVGAYRNTGNADNVIFRLRSAGLNPAYDYYSGLTRVMLANIPAAQVRNYLVRIKSLGFDEVIIREDRRCFSPQCFCF